MFKAIISAALVFGFGSVAFANEHEAGAPAHDEAGHEASAKKTTTTVEKTEKHDAKSAKKAHGGH